MMLDVDFWLCTDFRGRVLRSKAIMSRLKTGLAAFVLPAFEFTKQSHGVDPATFPSEKKVSVEVARHSAESSDVDRPFSSQDLIRLVKENKIGMFHKSWAPGHGSTNYTRYYASLPGEVYRVISYSHSYEPYVIFKKEGTPW